MLEIGFRGISVMSSKWAVILVTPCMTIFRISTTEGTHCLDVISNGQISGAGLYISQTFVLFCMGPTGTLAMNNWSLLLSPRPIGHRLSIHLSEILFKVHSMKWMTPMRTSVRSHYCEETEVVIHPQYDSCQICI